MKEMTMIQSILSKLNSKLVAPAKLIAEKIKLPIDKVMHIAVGLGIAIAVGVAALALGASLLGAAAIGGGVAALAAGAKEVYDAKSGKGSPELLDALATVAGGLVPLLIVLAIAVTSAPAKAADAEVKVIGYACDGYRGVHKLQIAVSGPGVVAVVWDNAKVCGKAI